MYDLSIFWLNKNDPSEGLFKEVDIINMEDEFILSLKPLLNDRVSAIILRFFEFFETTKIRDENNPIAIKLTEKVDRMKELLEDTCKKFTLHLKLEETGLMELLRSNDLESLMDLVTDTEGTIKQLDWLLSEEENWYPYIEPRKKQDFEHFLEMCSYLDTTASMHKRALDELGNGECTFNKTENMKKYLANNSKLFFTAHETRRKTGMEVVINRVGLVRDLRHALEYRKLCNENNIDLVSRRYIIN